MEESRNKKNYDTLLRGTLLSALWNRLVHDQKQDKPQDRFSDLDEIKEQVHSGVLKGHEDFKEISEFAS